jgi:hypothetical protein
MFEFSEDILVFPGVESGLLFAVEVLDLEEELKEAVVSLDYVKVDG